MMPGENTAVVLRPGVQLNVTGELKRNCAVIIIIVINIIVTTTITVLCNPSDASNTRALFLPSCYYFIYLL